MWIPSGLRNFECDTAAEPQRVASAAAQTRGKVEWRELFERIQKHGVFLGVPLSRSELVVVKKRVRPAVTVDVKQSFRAVSGEGDESASQH